MVIGWICHGEVGYKVGREARGDVMEWNAAVNNTMLSN